MRQLLLDITATFLGPRYIPAWAPSNLWVTKAFRILEQVFGLPLKMKDGHPDTIRLQSILERSVVDGVSHSRVYCFTTEAVLANIEARVRAFKLPRLVIVKMPQLVTPTGVQFSSPYRFAIAIDNSGNTANGASPQTVSYTATGSNLEMAAITQTGANDVTGFTYAGAALSVLSTVPTHGGVSNHQLYHKTTPATGANTLSLSATTNNVMAMVETVSGAAQTGQPDVTATGISQTVSVASQTITATVVTANSWLVGGVVDNTGGVQTASTGTFKRKGEVSATCLYDSNGTVGTGSQSLIVTFSPNTILSMTMCAIKPLAVSDNVLISFGF